MNFAAGVAVLLLVLRAAQDSVFRGSDVTRFKKKSTEDVRKHFLRSLHLTWRLRHLDLAPLRRQVASGEEGAVNSAHTRTRGEAVFRLFRQGSVDPCSSLKSSKGSEKTARGKEKTNKKPRPPRAHRDKTRRTVGGAKARRRSSAPSSPRLLPLTPTLRAVDPDVSPPALGGVNVCERKRRHRKLASLFNLGPSSTRRSGNPRSGGSPSTRRPRPRPGSAWLSEQ
ncbi:hypothetical protein H8959_006654 [Pygathrix nigripes]